MADEPTPAPGPVGPEPRFHPPDLMHDAVGPTPELSRRNARFAFWLVVLCLLLFGGTFAVGGLYRYIT
jgi:hypothetical protein